MSGAEATAVLGVISSVIAIVEGIKKVYDAASSANGLPEAFREVAGRLPIITGILESAEQHIRDGQLDTALYEKTKLLIEKCKERAMILDGIFQKVLPAGDASRWARYIGAVKALGKEGKVETLMKGLLDDLLLLASRNGLETATADQVDQLGKAIEDLSGIEPSIPDSEFRETAFANNNFGTGPMTANNVVGNQKFQANYGTGKQFQAETQTFHMENQRVDRQAFESNVQNFISQSFALKRPETPPNPSAIIPFGRDLDFVQRGKFLDQIHQACTEPDSRIALVGLGGVGKSQIAIEYAYQVRERSPETWVFWVHASNAARYEQSFREIADYLKIPGRQKPKSNIFQLLGSWLRNEAKGKWILVLDNVDEPSFLLEDPTAAQNGQASGLDSRNAQPLLSYLPHCPNGSILITTRSRDAALKLVESRDIIAVEPMDQADASALARKKLEKDEDKEGATALAVALECMPLAIVQATAYISQRAPRCTVQDYLEKFQNSDHKKASLLKYEGGQIRRDYEAKNSIIITWQISFDHIRQFRPSAADLLSLMSFFDRQGIPESLLRSRSEERRVVHDHDSPSTDDTDIEDIESNSSDGDGFENDVVTLRDYSFISINKDKTSFEMHSLVQIATRICRWEAAEKLFIKVIKRNKQKLGADHPDTLTSMANLASTYQKQGRWKEAEKLEVEVMETRKQKLGADHPSTLTSMNNLALTLHGLGQHAKAISLMKRCLQIGTQNFGDQHPNMSSSTRILARWEAEASLNDIGLGMDE